MQQAVQKTMLPSATDSALQSVGSVFAALFASPVKAIGSIVKSRRHRKAVAELSQLDDRMLADIGLSRSQIVMAVYGEMHRKR